jgi:hypothetical protein
MVLLTNKTRLIIKGFRQQEGVFNIYSPVLIITFIQILIFIATINKFEIYQIDVKITFLKW